MRPVSDHIEVPAPHLRIVDDELWNAAHARLGESRSKYLRATDGRLFGRPRDLESKYLLSGFARCGACGGGIAVRTFDYGKRRAAFYSCQSYHQRGPSVCQNRMKARMEITDAELLDVLREDILQPDIVEDAIQRALAQLAPGVRREETARLRAELAIVERSIANLTDALSAGGELTSLIARVRTEEARKLDLDARIATAEHLAEAGRCERD